MRRATASSSLRMWAGAGLCQHFSAMQQPLSPRAALPLARSPGQRMLSIVGTYQQTEC